MSPLQYQKHLRLHEARCLMLSLRLEANTAVHRVGYESASQFSRNTSASSAHRHARRSNGCAAANSPPERLGRYAGGRAIRISRSGERNSCGRGPAGDRFAVGEQLPWSR